MKLLTFTTLYPNSTQIHHGIFVEQRLRPLLASGQVESQVVAPVLWFPLKHARFGNYSQYAQVPPVEARGSVPDVKTALYNSFKISELDLKTSRSRTLPEMARGDDAFTSS